MAAIELGAQHGPMRRQSEIEFDALVGSTELDAGGAAHDGHPLVERAVPRPRLDMPRGETGGFQAPSRRAQPATPVPDSGQERQPGSGRPPGERQARADQRGRCLGQEPCDRQHVPDRLDGVEHDRFHDPPLGQPDQIQPLRVGGDHELIQPDDAGGVGSAFAQRHHVRQDLRRPRHGLRGGVRQRGGDLGS